MRGATSPHPMAAEQIHFEILGEDSHAIGINLDPGEAARAEPGVLLLLEHGMDHADLFVAAARPQREENRRRFNARARSPRVP